MGGGRRGSEQLSKQGLEALASPRWKCKLVSTLFLPSMDSENVVFGLALVIDVVKFHFQKESKYAVRGH